MDNVAGIAGSNCGWVTISSGTSASDMFDPTVWVLLVLPALLFLAALYFSSPLERLICAVTTILCASIMLYSIVDEYDNIFAVPLYCFIFGAIALLLVSVFGAVRRRRA